MSDNNCYLCQEPKSIVGHDTESCPNIKCKKCGQKGSNLSLNVDQKHDGNVCPREIKSENYDAQILDFVEGIKTFSRRFHNAGNGLIGNEDHPRILNGKNLT